jgi:hypothetical protein
MDKAACEQCKGTGVVRLIAGYPSIDVFRRACSVCDTGSVIWEIVFDLVQEVETEMRRLDPKRITEQIRGPALQRKSLANMPRAKGAASDGGPKPIVHETAAGTIRALRAGREIDLNIKKSGDETDG